MSMSSSLRNCLICWSDSSSPYFTKFTFTTWEDEPLATFTGPSTAQPSTVRTAYGSPDLPLLHSSCTWASGTFAPISIVTWLSSTSGILRSFKWGHRDKSFALVVVMVRLSMTLTFSIVRVRSSRLSTAFTWTLAWPTFTEDSPDNVHTAKVLQLLTSNPSLSEIVFERNVSSLPVSSKAYVVTECPSLFIILTGTTCNATLVCDVIEYVWLVVSIGAIGSVVVAFTLACSFGSGFPWRFTPAPFSSSVDLCSKEWWGRWHCLHLNDDWHWLAKCPLRKQFKQSPLYLAKIILSLTDLLMKSGQRSILCAESQL